MKVSTGRLNSDYDLIQTGSEIRICYSFIQLQVHNCPQENLQSLPEVKTLKMHGKSNKPCHKCVDLDSKINTNNNFFRDK